MAKRRRKAIYGVTLLTDHDVYLFKEGSHYKLYDKLGSHPLKVEGKAGTLFAVWAPNAERVSVIGDFNEWCPDAHPLSPRWDESGIWEGFIPGVRKGAVYKYHIVSKHGGHVVDKGDPFALLWQTPPETASVVWDLAYKWGDREWMERRKDANALDAPMSIYEVHLGSWRRVPDEGYRFLTYRELAEELVAHVKEMGFTHVEFLPVMEHPFYGSWGYQTTGYFAPTSRYGMPQDFMYLVDRLHQEGIGVILDWVPSHFPSDEHGLVFFDGTNLYEHMDWREGFHPDWESYIFNYGRSEVRNFLASSALFWLDRYHVDGLRVDAVASMLYRDYSRKEGEWIPNRFGGRENLEAIDFIRRLNETIYGHFPDAITVAEESTAWPMVSRPTYLGGLGFGLKWKMGWMPKDPIYRKYQHDQLTFSMWYAFWENFVLPLSHDEVVHGKGSLVGKMPGDEWQKMANLRLLFGYQYTHPGKKLLFMGSEWAQWNEWYHEASLDWHLTQYAPHQGVMDWVRDLNRAYRTEPALYEIDFAQEGFQWLDCRDWEQSILSYLRRGRSPGDELLVVCNFTPVPRTNYRAGVPRGGFWREILNSDAACYRGSGTGNWGGVHAAPLPYHGFDHSLSLTVPPLGMIVLKGEE
ncbi:glycogen branching protein [candidate division TA06 bacterium SM23_40]|uniref:1,4-alpha-glucan branching enzyme GlgB n=1 Tax=candidate division TA06 bacterium SM23_40 TaxID=1703774 RepID=A0A0S8G1L3_UNCT6|nr:MAG: glycogen branching protein [candidate division TA06 bacterium SM23_40]